MAFSLAALSDEISPELAQALHVMREEGISEVEVRSLLGKNVLELTDAEAERCQAEITAAGFTVSGLASPIGKSAIDRPAEYEADRMRRALELCTIFHTRRIRIFSFYPPEGTDQAPESFLPEAVARLRAMAGQAAAAGVDLVLENEFRLVGDVPSRIQHILGAVDSPALRFAWDPGNFVHSGVERPFDDVWPGLSAYTTCAHVKDYRRDGTHVPAGQGDGEWPRLVPALAELGGVAMVIEPHLKVARHSSGYSGPELFHQAVAAIRGLLAATR